MTFTYVGHDQMVHTLHIERRNPADPDLRWFRCEGVSVAIGPEARENAFGRGLTYCRETIEHWQSGDPEGAMAKYEYRIVLEQNTRTSGVVENADFPPEATDAPH